jgi:hypothetical protein
MKRHAIGIAAGFAVLLQLGIGAAEAAVTRFKCNVGSGRDALALEFLYDDVSRKAQVVGNNGLAEVLPHVGAYAVTFLEFLPTGSVQSTTIEIKTGAAVHSRHTVMGSPPDAFMPSQTRGRCSW